MKNNKTKRSRVILEIVVVFVLLMVLVGKRNGLDAFLAILFSLMFIIRVTLPVLYNGGPTLVTGLLTVLLSTMITLSLMHGPTKQCLLGIGTTLLGELAACILFAVFSSQLHLTGFQTDSGEGLLLIAQNTGLDIRLLLFAGMMISSLGVVMDVAVSILAALREVALAACVCAVGGSLDGAGVVAVADGSTAQDACDAAGVGVADHAGVYRGDGTGTSCRTGIDAGTAAACGGEYSIHHAQVFDRTAVTAKTGPHSRCWCIADPRWHSHCRRRCR